MLRILLSRALGPKVHVQELNLASPHMCKRLRVLEWTCAASVQSQKHDRIVRLDVLQVQDQ